MHHSMAPIITLILGCFLGYFMSMHHAKEMAKHTLCSWIRVIGDAVKLGLRVDVVWYPDDKGPAICIAGERFEYCGQKEAKYMINYMASQKDKYISPNVDDVLSRGENG